MTVSLKKMLYFHFSRRSMSTEHTFSAGSVANNLGCQSMPVLLLAGGTPQL